MFTVSSRYVAVDHTSALLVLIDERISNRTEFCVGENVTFICFLTSETHQWNVPGYIENPDGTVNRTSQPVEFGPFITLRSFTDPRDIDLSSSLSVIIFPEFQGTNITCSNFPSFTPQTLTNVQVLGEAK